MGLAEFEACVRRLQPRVALVLGSGLGQLPAHFRPEAGVGFGEVPGLTATTVHGHSGRIEVGECVGVPLLLFRGRLHYYEGHPWERVRRPVEFAADCGIQTLILTNAAGGIHAELDAGSLMCVRDHLFLQSPAGWRQPGPPSCAMPGGARPGIYSPEIVEQFQALERDAGRPLLAGVYAAVTGPCYETPREILALRAMGADAVGMSTAAEAEAAHARGLRVAAISCITNKAAGLSGKPLDHGEVLDVARVVVGRISELFERWLRTSAKA